DVHTGRIRRVGVLDDDVLAAERQRGAGRARGREEPHRADLEPGVLLEQGAHDGSDLSGGADDSDSHCCHRPVPPYTTAWVSSLSSPYARCAAATARSRSSARVTTLMRISEVEMRSMLTSSSLRARNSVAVTPGFERMPSPTTDSLPI